MIQRDGISSETTQLDLEFLPDLESTERLGDVQMSMDLEIENFDEIMDALQLDDDPDSGYEAEQSLLDSDFQFP